MLDRTTRCIRRDCGAPVRAETPMNALEVFRAIAVRRDSANENHAAAVNDRLEHLGEHWIQQRMVELASAHLLRWNGARFPQQLVYRVELRAAEPVDEAVDAAHAPARPGARMIDDAI